MTAREYPRSDALRRGVIARATIHESLVAREPAIGSLLSWDGVDYVLNNLDGTYAAITFNGPEIVGVFFDSASSFNPYSSNTEYDIEIFLRGIPLHLRSLAENHALRYNRQNYKGRPAALITAAFWSDGDYLTGAYSWADIFHHGAHIVSVELLGDTEAAWQEWKESYQCTADQLSVARDHFRRRMSPSPKSRFP